MSKNSDYDGFIKFKNTKEADNAKAILIDGMWMRDDGDDGLVWLDEHHAAIPTDGEESTINHMGTDVLYLEYSSRRNIHRPITVIVNSDGIDKEHTSYRGTSLDGMTSMWYWDEVKGEEVGLSEEEIQNIIGDADDDDDDDDICDISDAMDDWRWNWAA